MVLQFCPVLHCHRSFCHLHLLSKLTTTVLQCLYHPSFYHLDLQNIFHPAFQQLHLFSCHPHLWKCILLWSRMHFHIKWAHQLYILCSQALKYKAQVPPLELVSIYRYPTSVIILYYSSRGVALWTVITCTYMYFLLTGEDSTNLLVVIAVPLVTVVIVIVMAFSLAGLVLSMLAIRKRWGIPYTPVMHTLYYDLITCVIFNQKKIQ